MLLAQEPDYSYNYEISKTYVDYMNTLLSNLEDQWPILLDDLKTTSVVATEIIGFKSEIDTAHATGKDSCVTTDFKQYQDEALDKLQACVDKAPFDSYINLKNIVETLTTEIQTIDTDTKNFYDQCSGVTSCQDDALTTGLQKLEGLKHANKPKLDWLAEVALNTVTYYLSLCVVTENQDLLLEVKQDRYDIESCLNTGNN